MNYIHQSNKANKEINAQFYGKRLFEWLKQDRLLNQTQLLWQRPYLSEETHPADQHTMPSAPFHFYPSLPKPEHI